MTFQELEMLATLLAMLAAQTDKHLQASPEDEGAKEVFAAINLLGPVVVGVLQLRAIAESKEVIH